MNFYYPWNVWAFRYLWFENNHMMIKSDMGHIWESELSNKDIKNKENILITTKIRNQIKFVISTKAIFEQWALQSRLH